MLLWDKVDFIINVGHTDPFSIDQWFLFYILKYVYLCIWK